MLNRRQFLISATAIGAAAILPRAASIAFAAGTAPTVLRAGTRTLDVRGKAAKVFGITQPDGTSGLFIDVASPFRVHLQNDSGELTLIHWHGLVPPYQQDGVPGVSGPAIQPNGAADYDFPLAFPGTFWMHSHQGMQEQQLMAAPLIIHDASPRADEQEVVMMLHDFSFRSPEEIFAGLRKPPPSAGTTMGGMSGMPGKPTQAKPMQGMAMGANGGMPAMAGGAMPGMKMDLNDVAYDAFLANDRTLDDPDIVRVGPVGRVRLRIINGSSSSNFVIDLGRLKGELVAVDGHPVQPVTGARFPLATAQRIDLRLQLPRDRQAYPVLAVLEGERKRTGIVLAPAQARIVKLAETAEKAAPPLDLKMEQALRPVTPLGAKPADRTHQVALTGVMSPYEWSLNGVAYGSDTPMAVRTGERVELVMTNQTMMPHPMHLHGHVFQVVAINGKRFPGALRDTVLVPPATSVTVAFDADNPGRWAFHCHNLYHMESGMMTTLRYEDV
jgi:FtsP/CotA-like multicopper oxidase with cupredoxin domain